MDRVQECNPSCSSLGVVGGSARRRGRAAVAGLVVLVLLGAFAGRAGAQQTVAQWTFETSQPATAGPFTPEVNNSTGTSQAMGVHAGASTYSSPAGNGSAHSFSSNTWAVGDYYQFTTPTTGFTTGISVSFDQASSPTGPAGFSLYYSTDATNYTMFMSGYTVATTSNFAAATSGVPSTATPPHYSFDLSSIAALSNATTIGFRLVDNSTASVNAGMVAATGTDRVDNFTVTAAPEPTSLLLLGLTAAGPLGLGRRGRRQR